MLPSKYKPCYVRRWVKISDTQDINDGNIEKKPEIYSSSTLGMIYLTIFS